MEDGNINTNIKVSCNFNLAELIATNVVTQTCHGDDSPKGRYDMILGKYLLS